MTGRRLAWPPVGLALALCLAGCASTGTQSAGDVGAVDVANRTAVAVVVAIDGRDETVVGPGERASVTPVPTGSRRVRLTRPGGGHVELMLRVPAAGVARHDVLPGQLGPADEALLPEPPAFGSVEVENALPRVVAVTFDGDERGRVMPGERRVFRGVASGAVFAVARMDGGGRHEGRLEVPADGFMRWRVAPDGRPLIVTNATPEAAEVRIDGQVVGRVAAGEARTFFASPALHTVEARCEPSRRRFEQGVDLRELSEATWRIAGGSATAVIENTLASPVEVRRDGANVGLVAAGQRLRLEGLPAGPARFVATEVDVGEARPVSREAVLHLEAGDEARWRVEPLAPGLRVENRTDATVVLFAGVAGAASGQAVRLGELKPGAATQLQDLAARVGQRPDAGVAVEVAAWTPRGVQLGVHALKLVPGGEGAQVWEVRAPTGGLRVENASGEAVQLRVDGADFGELADGAGLGIGALAARAHLIEARGRLTGTVIRNVVEVVADPRGDAPTRLRLGASRVEVRVTNATGEAVVAVGGSFGGRAEPIAPNARMAAGLAPGPHVLRFTGVASGAPHVARIEVPDDATAPVEVELVAIRGALALQNDLSEAVAVSVRGAVIGSVEPQARVVFDGLAPGPIRIEAVGVTTGRFRTLEVVLPAGGIREAQFKARPATLIVENRADEQLDVWLEDAQTRVVGARRSVVAARSARGFPGLEGGAVDVRLAHARSGSTQHQRVVLEEGERRLLVVDAPRGLVRLDNFSGEAVSVRLGETLLARLDASARGVELALPAGTHDRELVWESGADGVAVTRSVEVQVRGGVVVTLPIRPLTGRLAVVNRTSETLEVLSGERVLGLVEAGASMVFEDLSAGTLRLAAREHPVDGPACEARARGCAVTQRATLRLDGGQTASWVLLAP